MCVLIRNSVVGGAIECCVIFTHGRLVVAWHSTMMALLARNDPNCASGRLDGGRP
jgi:hypothetical protein